MHVRGPKCIHIIVLSRTYLCGGIVPLLALRDHFININFILHNEIYYISIKQNIPMKSLIFLLSS